MAEAVAAEKILGKFDSAEARDKALEEIHKKVMGDDVAVPPWADDDAKNKAYTAYEKVLKTRKVEPESNGTTAEVKPTIVKQAADPLALGTAADDDPDVDSILVKAGLQAEEIQKQWEAETRLTDAQYAAFKKAGIGRKLADTMIAGEFAKAAINTQNDLRIRAEGVAVAGGEQEFKNLEVWFATNHPDRVAGLNAIIKADRRAFPEVVRMMMAAHAGAIAAGKATALVTGGPGAGDATVPTTWSQVSKLVEKANAGDANARRILNSLDRTKIKE